MAHGDDKVVFDSVNPKSTQTTPSQLSTRDVNEKNSSRYLRKTNTPIYYAPFRPKIWSRKEMAPAMWRLGPASNPNALGVFRTREPRATRWFAPPNFKERC